MNIKSWIIKKLGGVDREEHESDRLKYESWAVKYLTGKNGEVTPDCSIYHPFYGEDICIIRSKITVSGEVIKGVKVAPWCKQVALVGVSMLGGESCQHEK